jgi:serine protease Do
LFILLSINPLNLGSKTMLFKQLSKSILSLALIGASALSLTTPQLAQSQTQARGMVDFADLVERAAPAVVGITVSSKQGGARLPLQSRGRPQPQGDDDAIPVGSGSGFIITADGYLLTNHHVVNKADEILVVLSDKREFKGKLIGSDERTDVALVKIEANGLPFLKAGDVDKLRVGEWVMAIGSPFGLDQTVTAGIVSAKNREIGDFLQFIQTDAAINVGNSGGPLLNTRGEVVGINSRILAPSGGFQGISLAIPIDEAIRVSDSLRSVGRVVRGRLGISLGEVSKEVAEALRLPKASGAAVTSVEPGSPAEKAGIRSGDVILKFENRVIERWNELPRMVGAIKPGTKVTVQVWQGGKAKDIQATVIELEPPTRTAAVPGGRSEKPVPSAAGAASAMFGFAVSDLSEARKKQTRLPFGVMIDDVAESSPAGRAGLQKGDVILTINQVDVVSTAQMNEEAAKLDKTRPVAFLVWRQGNTTYIVLRPAASK